MQEVPAIEQGEVQVWCARVNDAAMKAAVGLLNEEEQARMERMRLGIARHEFVVGRALLRVLAGAATACGPREVTIGVGEHGKPRVEGVEFSVAHSHGLVVLALCREAALGVDLEWVEREIEALEKRGDAIVHEVHAAVRRSLFPPHPRSAIVDLINHMDDILDLAEDAAETLHLYHVTAITPEALRLAGLALESVRQIQQAVAMLADPARNRELLVLCSRVDELESEADHVLRAAMSKLFREEPDVRELIKLRAVYEVLEELTDVCKDVSAELESIVLGRLGG